MISASKKAQCGILCMFMAFKNYPYIYRCGWSYELLTVQCECWGVPCRHLPEPEQHCLLCCCRPRWAPGVCAAWASEPVPGPPGPPAQCASGTGVSGTGCLAALLTGCLLQSPAEGCHKAWRTHCNILVFRTLFIHTYGDTNQNCDCGWYLTINKKHCRTNGLSILDELIVFCHNGEIDLSSDQ